MKITVAYRDLEKEVLSVQDGSIAMLLQVPETEVKHIPLSEVSAVVLDTQEKKRKRLSLEPEERVL